MCPGREAAAHLDDRVDGTALSHGTEPGILNLSLGIDHNRLGERYSVKQRPQPGSCEAHDRELELVFFRVFTCDLNAVYRDSHDYNACIIREFPGNLLPRRERRLAVAATSGEHKKKLYLTGMSLPDQGRITNEGKAYLDKEFPNLDRVKSAVIVEGAQAAAGKPTTIKKENP